MFGITAANMKKPSRRLSRLIADKDSDEGNNRLGKATLRN